MKKSLVISEKEKYGPSVVQAPGEKTPPKQRKFAPTLTLRGKQVDAFCGCQLKVGDTGQATVHYTVKSLGGDNGSYGDEVADPKKKPAEMVLQLTHVEAEGEEGGEDPKEEKTETPAAEETEESAEPSITKETVSPKDADLED